MKQDRLSELEILLNDVDADEDTQLFLSSRRHDQNSKRRQLLAEIDDALHAYGLEAYKTQRTIIY